MNWRYAFGLFIASYFIIVARPALIDDTPYAWTDWSNWGKCQAVCGHGVRRRSRTCPHDPEVMYYMHCGNDYHQTTQCDAGPCDVMTLQGREVVAVQDPDLPEVAPIEDEEVGVTSVHKTVIDISFGKDESLEVDGQAVSSWQDDQLLLMSGRDRREVHPTSKNNSSSKNNNNNNNNNTMDVNGAARNLAIVAENETIQMKSMKRIFIGLVIFTACALGVLSLTIVCQMIIILRSRKKRIRQHFSRDNLMAPLE